MTALFKRSSWLPGIAVSVGEKWSSQAHGPFIESAEFIGPAGLTAVKADQPVPGLGQTRQSLDQFVVCLIQPGFFPLKAQAVTPLVQREYDAVSAADRLEFL